MDDLKVCTVQSNLYWEDKSKNLKMFEKHLENVDQVDLIVLPEMFSTGFSMNAAQFSEAMDGPTVQWMKSMCMQKRAAILGSIIIKDHDQYFNRCVCVQESGDVLFYDKQHLFSMGEEHLHYTSGKQNLNVEIKGWQVRIIICYDLRFSNTTQNNQAKPYDALVCIANWPDKRIAHWDVLLKARAIENQSYVIGLNRYGTDASDLMHSGHSSIVSPFGELEYFTEKEEVNIHTLSAFELKLNRRQFPFIKDMKK